MMYADSNMIKYKEHLNTNSKVKNLLQDSIFGFAFKTMMWSHYNTKSQSVQILNHQPLGKLFVTQRTAIFLMHDNQHLNW